MAQKIESLDGAAVINIIATELSRSSDMLVSISTGNNPDNSHCLNTLGVLTRGLLPYSDNPINIGPESLHLNSPLWSCCCVPYKPVVSQIRRKKKRLRGRLFIKKCNVISKGG